MYKIFWMRRCWLVCWAMLASCQEPYAARDTRSEAFCVDAKTVRSCHPQHGCGEVACRHDELCSLGRCMPWQEADLWANFTIEYNAAIPRRITVQIEDGGFPREWVEHLRFDFGDGHLGFGDWLWHTYESPGIYPVSLEVRLHGDVRLRAEQLAVLGNPLSEVVLTVNDIPQQLNGSVPFTSNNHTPHDPGDDYEEGFHLLLPRYGFTVDVHALDTPDNPIVPESLVLLADVALGEDPAGSNLAHWLQPRRSPYEKVPRWRWEVEEAQAFPEGMASLGLQAERLDGSTVEMQLSIECVEFTEALDPFSQPAQWLLRFDMDYFTAEPVATGNTLGMQFESIPNDVPDFVEELVILGAQGSESATGAKSVAFGPYIGANAIYAGWIKQHIIREALAAFDAPLYGLPIELIADDAPHAPVADDFSSGGDFSIMRLGGAMVGVLGRSYVRLHNHERVDNSAIDMGVATGSILSAIGSTPGITDFLDPIKPGVGTPVGEHPADGVVLSDTFDPYDPNHLAEHTSRYADLSFIARLLAIPIGSVTAHEMGHAMGLMPLDAPPKGLFGGRVDASVTGPSTDSFHAHFPPVNLMQAGGDIFMTLSFLLGYIETPASIREIDLALALFQETRLSPYSRAYFRRQLTYDPGR